MQALVLIIIILVAIIVIAMVIDGCWILRGIVAASVV